MAKYQAVVSFSGKNISMRGGEVRELSDQALIDDLLKAKVIFELVETVPKASAKEEPKPEEKPKSSRKGKKS